MQANDVPQFERLTWTEANDLLSLRPVGLLPIGAIEAHGPHLPLNTDIIIARGMARAGGERLRTSGLPAVILPPITYSVSFAGACFPGTTPVTAGYLYGYLADILKHLSTQGFRAICICNAHLEPAHVDAVQKAVQTTQKSTSTPIVFPDKRNDPRTVELGAEFVGGSRHAGSYETSIVLAEEPDSVRRTTLEELEPVWIDLPAALRAGAGDFKSAGAELGYFGDPASSTEEDGRALLDVLGSMIHDHVLEALKDGSQSLDT